MVANVAAAADRAGAVIEVPFLGDTVSLHFATLNTDQVAHVAKADVLDVDEWRAASPELRLYNLNRLDGDLSRLQQRPTHKVVVDDEIAPGTGGQFHPRDGAVDARTTIRREAIQSASPLEAWETVGHESRHAHQFDAIERPARHPEIDATTRTAWADNFAHYTAPATNEAAYREQPIERDAYAFGKDVAKALEWRAEIAQALHAA